MDGADREPMKSLSVLRMALGVGALLAPRTLLQGVVGVPATRQAKYVARLFATREIALGAATLDALEHHEAPVRLLEINMMVDALDGAAALLAFRRLPLRARLITVVGVPLAVAAAARLRQSLEAGEAREAHEAHEARDR